MPFLPLLAVPVHYHNVRHRRRSCFFRTRSVRIYRNTHSLFPFLVISSYIIASGTADTIGKILRKPFGAMFGISGELAPAFIIGLISGYPAGAMTAAELVRNKKCDSDSASRALAFCSNTGPAFLIGGIGAGLLGDRLHRNYTVYCRNNFSRNMRYFDEKKEYGKRMLL